MNNKTTKDYVFIALKLLTICALVALIVATVNFITYKKIIENEKQNTADALSEIFKADFGNRSFAVDKDSFIIKDGDKTIAQCTAADCELLEDVNALYVITDESSSPLFYCVSTAPMGFKDVINMLVAINPDFTVKGVKVVSMKETSGIGTKASDESYLARFNGLNKNEASMVDTISGATKTSKPIINAVSTACKQVEEYASSIGGEQ